MSDSACGFNRQPIDSNWTQEQKECEAAAWNQFSNGCLVCSGGLLCISQKYTDYINARAQCLTDPESGCGCGG